MFKAITESVGAKRISLQDAERIANVLVGELQDACHRIEVCGSIRRKSPDVGDIDLVAIGEVQKVLEKFPRATGRKRISFTFQGRKVNLWMTEPGSWGAAVLFATGSSGYGIGLRRAAQSKGLKLTDQGLFRDGRKIAGRTEEDIFKLLGKTARPPEERI